MRLLRAAAAAALCAFAGPPASAPEPFDWTALRAGWRARIEAARAAGKLPFIDVESSYNDLTLAPALLARVFDRDGVTLAAFSPEYFDDDLDRVETLWPTSLHRLIAAEPAHFIPVPNADLERVLYRHRDPYAYLDDLFAQTLREGYPMLGEFMFVSYPSPAGMAFSSGRLPSADIIGITLSSPLAEKIFAFSQEHDIPFQMHLEVEDALLPSLEALLTRYPKAKVIWCHGSRVRFRARAGSYGPDYVRRLLRDHPNLYFDLASYLQPSYPGANYWKDPVAHDRMKKEWVRLISDYPWRFMAALDLGGDRMAAPSLWIIPEMAMLQALPKETREIVAYKAAWKLLFREDL